MDTMKWRCLLLSSIWLTTLLDVGHCQENKGCPSQELILPCRCLQREKEYQIWCSHSDLPRVLEGLKAIGQHIFQPIDELILENNNLPSLPGKTFLPLKVMRLMLRYNSLERVSNGWLAGLEDTLMELFIVEPDLRSLPEESLQNLRTLEAITIQTTLMKRLPQFSNLPKLRYLKIESTHLVELSPRHFRNMPEFEKIHIHGSARLERLEAGLFQDLPRLELINISFCGVTWMHMRSITRLPVLTELSLVGNKINDAGMIGRGSRDLPALQIMRLDFNDIDRISEASFVDLPSLKKLYLSNNRITELHHGAFHRVPKLRSIDLSNNNVRRVHPESFLQHSGSGLEELLLMNNDISHIAELRSILDALPRLTFLDMSHNSLEAVPFGALRGHATIEELHLDYNKIHIIEREAFTAMPALRELRLKNNSLSNRLEFPLWNLPALKGLDLSGNYFRRVEPRLLGNLPSLRKLDLSSNDISLINPTGFLATPELEHVNLSYNALPSLHPATFRHLLGLYELDVSHNRLIEFVPGLPRGIENLYMMKNLIGSIPIPPSPDLDLPGLRVLEISSNAIQTIPAGALRTMPQLKRLYIGKNALTQLEENALAGLEHLEVLDVQNNRISKLHPHALKELGKLHELNIRENRLDILIPELFKSNPNLKKLDVSRNRLTEILSGTLENTRNIEIIEASHNSLVNLPPGLYGMKKLKVLDLTDNRLKDIHPDTLSSLVSLEELRMSRNFVQELKKGAFDNLPNLKILHLDNNELVDIESKSIHALPSLQSIKISQNRLREIPNAAFSDLPSLQMAELQENELLLLGNNAFHRVPHLLMLNLSVNHIQGLENAGLRSLRSLEMLDLSNNEIVSVSGSSLEKLEWLVELRMDNNKICSINGATFNGMPRLRVLSLKNNKMVSFPEYAVQKLRGNIAVLDIDGNPLSCTCSLLWLRAWLQEQSVMGPRCLDGSLLREIRLSRQECGQENNVIEPPAPGCEFDSGLQSSSQVLTPHWLNIRDNKTKLNINNKLNLAPSPEESDYFYDDYVDYPINETLVQQLTTEQTIINSSHFIAGDTPVIYAATSKNKTKGPDTPKGVVGSPSSSGFTFFGLPLPNLNLNSLLGGNVRMDDKRKGIAPAESMNAERKAAIVNSPPRFPLPELSIRKHPPPPPNVPLPPRPKPPDLPMLRPKPPLPPDLPARPIIGMHPPAHPEIHSGFMPIIPSGGGFIPMVPDNIPRKNISHIGSIGSVERVNLTQQTSSSIHSPSTLAPNFIPTNVPIIPQNFINKRGPTIEPPIPQPTQQIYFSSTSAATEKTKEPFKDTTSKIDEIEELEDFLENENVKITKAHVEEIEQIKNISNILSKPIELDTAAPLPSEKFEDIFKEVIDNVSLPYAVTTTEISVTEKHIENLLSDKEKPSFDLLGSFTNKEHKNADIEIETKKEVIGTPLSALLIPGGQQPQFRPSGRPSIKKIPNPHVSSSSPLQSNFDLLETKSDDDDDITVMAHNREAKNGFFDSTSDAPSGDNMGWYFANYNKTNLEPYIGSGTYPSEGHTILIPHIVNFVIILHILLLI